MKAAYEIRRMTNADLPHWAAMRSALWPEDSEAGHRAAITSLLAREDAWAFLAASATGAPLGFAELAIRPYANGCDSAPVPFLEGIWVRADVRRQGIGTGMLAYMTSFLLEHGFREVGSDTPIANLPSQAAHRAWGFSETERVVYFRKLLHR
jgi:aminoglycoside 6'-N-acetyltransferase I